MADYAGNNEVHGDGDEAEQQQPWWAECDYEDGEEEWIKLGWGEGPQVVGCVDVYDTQPVHSRQSQFKKTVDATDCTSQRQSRHSTGDQAGDCETHDDRDSTSADRPTYSQNDASSLKQATSPPITSGTKTQNEDKALKNLELNRDTNSKTKLEKGLDSPPQPKHAVPAPPTPEASDPELHSGSQSSKSESMKDSFSVNLEEIAGKRPTEKAAAHGANPSSASPSNKRQRADDQHVETDGNHTKSKRRRTG